MLTKYGYPGEHHSVVTADGYILGLYRIPYGKKCPEQPNKPPVLVMHGLLSNSIDWIISGVDSGLGEHTILFPGKIQLVMYAKL